MNYCCKRDIWAHTKVQIFPSVPNSPPTFIRFCFVRCLIQFFHPPIPLLFIN